MIEINKIYCGDNLEILEQMEEKVDLVYLDPPFESDQEFNYSLEAKVEGSYFEMMNRRIAIIKELLSEKGSLFCHCDWRSAANFQILLDKVFGRDNRIGNIIWQRTKPSSYRRYLPNTYDVILYYGKSKNIKFYQQYLPFTDTEAEEKYRYVDDDTGRRYRLISLIDNISKRPEHTFEFLGVTRAWRFSKERMEEEYKQGRIVQPKPGAVPQRKQYINEGKPITDIWSDISYIRSATKENTGYPGQKPLALLERIILMSTEVGDLVLDPFCGSGTTLVAAEKLNRNWLGIDISSTACQITSNRLVEQSIDLKDSILNLHDSRDLNEIINMPHYEFENWALTLIRKLLVEDINFAKGKGLEVTDNVNVFSITKRALSDFALNSRDVWLPVIVKKKEDIEARDISNFVIQLRHDKLNRGLFIALDFTQSALTEIKRRTSEGFNIIPIRVSELIHRQIDV